MQGRIHRESGSTAPIHFGYAPSNEEKDFVV